MNQNFFTQLLARLAKDNPEFFKIIQMAAVAIGAISAAFSFIDTTHANLPSWLTWLENKEVWISSFVAAVMAQLPNKNTTTKD